LSEIALWHWVAFSGLVVVLLALDLGVFHRHSHETTFREALFGTIAWCSLALMFDVVIWLWLGSGAAWDFLAGYLVEWSLSMDNVFVFAVIFSYFLVPKKYQYRVLFWGILGAIVMRLSFVLLGAELIRRFEWVMWIFGAFLIYTGIQLARHDDADVHPEKNLLLRVARRLFSVSKGDHGKAFFVREEGRLCVTPLFLVLLVVESSDVVFAVDSVPAIFGVVTRGTHYMTFIVFTSNVFAILGLRALYFMLAGMMDMFRYLHYGLSAVLVFVGLKMVVEAPEIPGMSWLSLSYWVRREGDHHFVPPWASLLVVFTLLAISVIASVVASRRDALRQDAEPPQPGESQPAEEGVYGETQV